MAIQNKQDSNQVQTSYAEENAFKSVSSPTWRPLEVNSFSNAGATFTKVAAAPIASDRQRKKGVTTDLDVQVGFQSDLTQYNLTHLLQGLFFADIITSLEATTATSVNGSNAVVGTGMAGFASDDICVIIGGTSVAGNSNRYLRVTASTATTVTMAQTLVAETLPAGARLIKVGKRAGAGDLEIDATGALPVLTSTTLNFSTTGLVSGGFLAIGGDDTDTFFATAGNNSVCRIRSVSANSVTLDKSSKGALVTDDGATKTIEIYFGQVLKNQNTSTLIERRTYQIERTLGAPDDALPAEVQSEYFTGCVFNEATVNLQQADKITVDCAFVGADQELRTGATGVKSGTRLPLAVADRQNVSTDLKRVRLSRVVSGDEAPAALFAYFPNATVTVSNNVEPLKALTVLGAFDMNAGDFTVNAQVEGFFSSVDVLDSIRDNDSLTLDIMAFRNNQGWCMDMPLCTAGEGTINVEKNASIMVPLALECASGEEVDSNLDYTLSWTFWPVLPTRHATPNA